MKCLVAFSLVLMLNFQADAKEKVFIGSTPADPVVRTFLGISLTDSIDFIRWKLFLGEKEYRLECNYGISKANTNGFIDGGKKISLTGAWTKTSNFYRFQNKSEVLNAAELNRDLLQLMDNQENLLVGNGGWSYTLNNVAPSATDQINIIAKPGVLLDSIAFQGRTPCKVPGVVPAGTLCYKLKWYLVLYANAARNEPATYKIFGTAFRNEGVKTGTWKIISGKYGNAIYQLNDKEGRPALYLSKLDEHVFIFTDRGEKLLVGDEDFSYTLNYTSFLNIH